MTFPRPGSAKGRYRQGDVEAAFLRRLAHGLSLLAAAVMLVTGCAGEPGGGRPETGAAGGTASGDASRVGTDVMMSAAEAVPGGFVASSRGEVYYWAGCDNWRSIPDTNQLRFATAAEAEDAGYRPSTARGCQSPEVLAGESPAETGSCTVVRIADGDTVLCQEAAARIRLLLVDAPEAAQRPQGETARLALEQLLPPGSVARVELDEQPRDQYGRILAYLYTPDGRMVNEAMARAGYSTLIVVRPNVRHRQRIEAAVEEAEEAGRGLWREGFFECSPRQFRAGDCGGG